MTGLPEPLWSGNKIEEKILRHIFNERLKGNWPKFGSPETRCAKCMFFGVTCGPVANRVGCLGGWKMTEEQW